MEDAGKTIRMKRLIDDRGACVICALDHGMTSPTYLEGLTGMEARVREVQEGGANVIMMSRGFFRRTVGGFEKDTSLALLLTASAAQRPGGSSVVPIGTVDEALRLGADAVVAFVALAGENEPEMIAFASRIGRECMQSGMPFIAEAEYPTTYQSLESLEAQFGAEYLLRNARLCVELGADIVKTNWTGDQGSFARLVEAVKAPVVLAGGSRIPDEELLTRMQLAIEAGAVGCSVGRNIFQHKNPRAMTRALSRVIRERWNARDALAELRAAV